MANEKQELIDELKTLLAEQNVMEIKEQVENLKARFYRDERTEEEEAAFKALLEDYRKRRAEVAKKVEAEQAQNLLRKENILEQMKALAESETADVLATMN